MIKCNDSFINCLVHKLFMSFINKLNELKKPYLKDLLFKEIHLNRLHACRVLNFEYNLTNNKNGFPKGWMKEDFSLVKNIKDLNKHNIITRPTNLLVIEFDKLSEFDYDDVRSEALSNIQKICKFLDRNNLYYIVSDHNKHQTSYSPHIYILFEDLPIGDNHSFNRFNYDIKSLFIDYLEIKCKLNNKYTRIDRNFINQNGNMPLIFQIHWKAKHKGAVQELINEGEGKLITIDKVVKNCVRKVHQKDL